VPTSRILGEAKDFAVYWMNLVYRYVLSVIFLNQPLRAVDDSQSDGGCGLSYWVAVLAKNAASRITETLTSITNQTVKPERIVVVNDGSSDGTSELLAHASREYSIIRVLDLPDRGYDIRRVPSNVNRAIESASDLRTEYLMISGDDSTYPPDYVELLIRKMSENRRIGVASGRPKQGGLVLREHSPSGSGRIIRSSLLESSGGRFPVRAGWEAWLLYRALMMGYSTKVLDGLVYEHVRPRGSGHQFTYWGAAMYTLGYHPLYALGRIGRQLTKLKSTRSSIALFRGYLTATLGSDDPFITPFDPTLRGFVALEQTREIGRVVVSIISRGNG